ncbi:MAG: hypothetical protein DBX55_08575 [Verrucomicrobia bacterium]|nr:MAG: hypothetical protein DBX55_08575 [Verrucomicrobiota bacterium]
MPAKAARRGERPHAACRRRAFCLTPRTDGRCGRTGLRKQGVFYARPRPFAFAELPATPRRDFRRERHFFLSPAIRFRFKP